MLPEPHPDTHHDYRTLIAIRRGGNQAIEDKAIAEYMKVHEELGKEEAEKVYFEHFKKSNNAVGKRKG